MYQCLKFILFRNDNLHVLDGLSVYHQQFKTVHTATGIYQTDAALCLLAVRDGTRSISYHLASYMYNSELLMMEGKTVRNM